MRKFDYFKVAHPRSVIKHKRLFQSDFKLYISGILYLLCLLHYTHILTRKGWDLKPEIFSMARQPVAGRGFTITHFRHTTLGRTPLDEWLARRRDLYLTTHNTHNRQTSMPPAGFEPVIPAKRAAADPRLRPHGHWDLPQTWNTAVKSPIPFQLL
jgi:hypothetical protein